MGKSSGGIRGNSKGKRSSLDRTAPGLAPGKTMTDVVEALAFQDKSIKKLQEQLDYEKSLGEETSYTKSFNAPINDIRIQTIDVLERQLKVLKSDYEKTLSFLRKNFKSNGKV